MSTNNSVYKLVQFIVRAFYDDVHVVVMEALLNYQTSEINEVREADLVKKVNLRPKTVTQALNELKADFIVVRDTKPVEKKKGQKKFTKEEVYWKIDYKQFLDAVRLRMKILANEVSKKEKADPTYVCTSCNEEYTAFQVARLLDMNTGCLFCSVCGCEVIESLDSSEKHAETVAGKETLEVRFNSQLKQIIELLKESSDFVVPIEHRWNFREIVSKQAANKKIQEQKNKIEREKKYGSHSKSSSSHRSTTTTSLGATAHVAKASGSAAANFQFDPQANFKVALDDEENAHNEERKEDKPVQKKPHNPYFLQQSISSKEYSDYNDTVETEDNEDNTTQGKDKQIDKSVYHQLLEEFHEDEKKKAAEAAMSDDEFDMPEIPQEPVDEILSDVLMEEQPAEDQSQGVMVMVKGVPVPYSAITPEHEADMTPEEYQVYDQIRSEQEGIYDF